jgi:hypothetical protein
MRSSGCAAPLLKLRLVRYFLLLALAHGRRSFVFGMQKALSAGWREAVAPLVADYVDRLAAEIGAAAQCGAGAARWPNACRSRCASMVRRCNWQSGGRLRAALGGRSVEDADGARTTAPAPAVAQHGRRPPHRVRFGRPPGVTGRATIGWVTLGALLLFHGAGLRLPAAAAAPAGRHRRRRAQRFGRGDFTVPIQSDAR